MSLLLSLRSAMKITLLLCSCLGLFACAVNSPSIRHLQLSAGPVQDPALQDEPLVLLDTVAIPDYLLRDELLLRDDAYALRYDGTQRWAEPLDIGIQRVLAERLEAQLGTRQVIAFPEPPRAPIDWELRIDVHEFEALGTQVKLRAEGRWDSGETQESATIVVAFDQSLPLAAQDGKTIAEALSQLLWDFSEELAQALQAH